jgi:hypothetical protein
MCGGDGGADGGGGADLSPAENVGFGGAFGMGNPGMNPGAFGDESWSIRSAFRCDV